MVRNTSLAFLVAVVTCHHLNRAWNKVGGDKNWSERTREDLSQMVVVWVTCWVEGENPKVHQAGGSRDFSLADGYTFTFRNRRSFDQGQSSVYLYLARLSN